MKRPPAKRITFAFSLALLCAFTLGGCGRDADAPDVPPVAAEPGVADAVAVLERYYRAIDQGDYADAYALWSDGGRASGQEFAAFAAGFDDTASVAVDVGAPGRVEGAAGSRYVSIPVVVRATHDDGSEHRYAGDYTLRLRSGERVLAHVPSHHDHQIGEWIGIRAVVDHVVTFDREPASTS